MIKRLSAALAALLLLPSLSGAAWWVENDYVTGSNGAKRDSLTAFHAVGKTPLLAGVGGAFYKDSAVYSKMMYSVRLPLLYTGPAYNVYFSPFVYPRSSDTGSGAYGAKAYYQAAFGPETADEHLKLLLGAAAAVQKARLTSGAEKTFSEASVEAQIEKSYYGQFFLMGSVAAFSRPAGVSNATLVKPALDHADMAYMGAFPQVTAIPDWVGTAQISRSMKPDFNSYIYLGYSKISLRSAPAAGSAVLGLKLEVSEKTTLDLAYNALKRSGSAGKNYYRVLLRTLF